MNNYAKLDFSSVPVPFFPFTEPSKISEIPNQNVFKKRGKAVIKVL